MKKNIGTLLAISLFSVAIAYEGMEERIDTLEKEMQEISARNPQDTLGVGFTTASPEVDGQNAFITFDILYWHAKVGGTEYAYSFKPQIVLDPQDLPVLLPARDGATKHNQFDWEWGLKIGLGYNVPHDNWDIYAQYTWYEPNSTDHSTKTPPSGLLSLRSFEDVIAIKAKSHFDIGYNNVDIELGRSYFMSSFLSFRPFISAKSTWIDLKQDTVYTASPLDDEAFGFFEEEDTNGHDFKVKESCQFKGIGPRIGVNSRWHLGYGYSIFGEIAGSILYGHFKTLHREYWPPHTVTSIDSDSGQLFKVTSKFHRFVPYARMFGGLEWGGSVNHCHQHIRLKLGYEVQYYWRMNQNFYSEEVTRGTGSQINQARSLHEKTSEDVMFYGVTGEFRLDF